MTPIEVAYAAMKQKHGAHTWPEFEVPGGKVAVHPDATLAIVYTDGRYPASSEGYHLNERITETEEVLWGAAVVEWLQPPELRVMRAGDVLAFAPGRPYSVSGKCVSLIRMDPPWDASQKRFVLAEPIHQAETA
jgi:hypothetical protein